MTVTNVSPETIQTLAEGKKTSRTSLDVQIVEPFPDQSDVKIEAKGKPVYSDDGTATQTVIVTNNESGAKAQYRLEISGDLYKIHGPGEDNNAFRLFAFNKPKARSSKAGATVHTAFTELQNGQLNAKLESIRSYGRSGEEEK